MHKVETLNEITHLAQSRFGRPRPRHGLKLLYWFANDCVAPDQSTLQCDPENRDFGFHSFGNRHYRNAVKLLPDVNFPYYVVGNLNSPGANELPDYVREDYTGLQDGSNTDRIIVSIVDDEWVDKVYVTEHDDQKNYNAQATYRISKGLLKFIRNLELQSFLEQTGYIQNIIYQLPMIALHSEIQDYYPDEQLIKSTADNDFESGRRNRCCECTIL